MEKHGSPLHLSHYFSKQQDSGKQTRNPTTIKKIEDNSLEFKRTNPFQHKLSPLHFYPHSQHRNRPPHHASFYQTQIMRLSIQKQRHMQSRRYQHAENLEKRIHSLKKSLVSFQQSRLIESHQKEKRSVSEAHQRQMHYLNSSWRQYFRKLQKRERSIFESFQEQQQREIIEANRRSLRSRQRCCSQSCSREVIQLQNKQSLLQRTGDFDHLKQVKRLLNQAVAKEKRRRSLMLERDFWKEEQRVKALQSKKYNALVERLEEYRRDKERVYLREQKRLKQKYKNVLQKLQHQQKQQTFSLQQHIGLEI